MKQIEYFGNGAINNINTIIEHHNIERILLVTGRSSYESSGAKNKIAFLTGQCETQRFSDFSPNPEIEDIMKGIEKYESFQPDMIIAVGGGSSLDMGKLIRIFSSENSSPVEIIKKEKFIEDKGIPLVAIPTTAGSGSEATHFAVVYIGADKYSVAHENISAEYSIIDPELTSSMSPRLTAVTGMDAFCHAVESYWAVNSTPKSRKYAKEALQILITNLESAVNSPTPSTRQEMARAANLAGKAINISKTTAAHALSYAITKYYGIPHGHAAALTIGMFFILNSKSDEYPKLNLDLDQRMKELYLILEQNNAYNCNKYIDNLMKNIGLERTFDSLGISDDNKIIDIVQKINIERLSNHPQKISLEDITKYLKNMEI